jgi:hypothetical protein
MSACWWTTLDGVDVRVAAADPRPFNHADDEPGRRY